MAKEKKIRMLFCTNDRGEGRRSCGASGANALRKHAIEMSADILNLKVKRSDCLGHCKHGPVIQIVPGKALYRCRDFAEVEQLLTQCIRNGETASELQIDLTKKSKKKS